MSNVDMRGGGAFTRTLLIVAVVVSAAILASCGSDGLVTQPSMDTEPTYIPQDEPTAEPISAPTWHLAMRATGGTPPGVTLGYDVLGSAPGTFKRSRLFSLHGGDVKLHWVIRGDSKIYLIADLENNDRDAENPNGPWPELETDFAHSDSMRLEQHWPPGRYFLAVGFVNCRWRLEVYEKR